MACKHSPNNKQQKDGKSFEICAGLPCEIKAKLYFVSILQRLAVNAQHNICINHVESQIKVSFYNSIVHYAPFYDKFKSNDDSNQAF